MLIISSNYRLYVFLIQIAKNGLVVVEVTVITIKTDIMNLSKSCLYAQHFAQIPLYQKNFLVAVKHFNVQKDKTSQNIFILKIFIIKY